jgi:hypothetical protein
MDKTGKAVAIISIIGVTPLVIGSILDSIGIIDIGTGLGLGVFMMASVMLSLVVIFVSSVVVAIKRILKS